MLSEDTLKAVLLAVSAKSEDDLERTLEKSEDLTPEEGELVRAALATATEPAARARALGDALRGAGTIDFLSNECYRAAFYLGDGLSDLRTDPLFGFFSTKRTGRILDKWIHYFPIYSEHFSAYRGTKVRILEIGVYRGGSLDMWRWFFGPDAVIVGVDIDERAREVSAPDHVVEIGDQTDPDFLRSLSEKYGPFDIVIDDGGHEMRQQIVTAETLFPLIADGGVLLTEDCHTSYWAAYQGGTGMPGTFIEWCKAKVDDVNAYHQARAVDPVWTDSLASLAFYDSVVVLKKKRRFAPFAEQVGHAEFLMLPRSTAQQFTELRASRDSAVAERDAVRAQDHGDRAAMEEELRQLRAELAGIRPSAALLNARLDQARADLDATRTMVRELRRAAASRVRFRRRGGSS
jgi:hypothetical protein